METGARHIANPRREKALETAFRSWIWFSDPQQVGRALIKAWPELEQLDVEVVLITEEIRVLGAGGNEKVVGQTLQTRFVNGWMTKI